MTPLEISELMKHHGIRPTPQRIAVFQFLDEHRIHASADMIFETLSKEFPSFSKTTIYNSINALEEGGLIRPVYIEGEFKRYDANTTDHGHFKCLRCGKITDFLLKEPDFWRESLPEFHAKQCDVFVYGVCSHCEAPNTDVS